MSKALGLLLWMAGAMVGCGSAEPNVDLGDDAADEELGETSENSAPTFPSAVADGATSPFLCASNPGLPTANYKRTFNTSGVQTAEVAVTPYMWSAGSYNTSTGKVIYVQRGLVPAGSIALCSKSTKVVPPDHDAPGAPPNNSTLVMATYSLGAILPASTIKGWCPNHSAKVAPNASNVQLNDPNGLERDATGYATGRVFMVKLADGTLEPLGVRNATGKAERVNLRTNWCRGPSDS